MNKPTIGIRPVIDGRWGGVRESLEVQTMNMAHAAQKLISENLHYPDGSPVQCVISPTTIGGSGEASICADFFSTKNVCATLTVTPCWCYGSETMDIDPLTIKAVWGFNGTERPGAVYLAAAMSAHAQRGLPAFSIYGKDVQDANDNSVPADVQEKLLQFARCAIAVGCMRNKSYVSIGNVSMGIAGCVLDPNFMQKYLGVRPEWVDMSEVNRRLQLGIYDPEEYSKALKWTRENCKEGIEINPKPQSRSDKDRCWETSVKMTLICKDIMLGNPALKEMGFDEESIGRNGIFGGFQGQRSWTDHMPNADFTESILNSTFDWNGIKQPTIFATENDTLNATAMLFSNLLNGRASVFADVRTYWSPESVERVTGHKLEGKAENGIMHLINSGAAAMDGSGVQVEDGVHTMKQWWKVSQEDVKACLDATTWCPANLQYFRGGGFSSLFVTRAEMPVTLIRVNLVDGLGPVLQLAEGYTVELPENVSKTLHDRTDRTWPCTWFAPSLTGDGAFTDVYSVMANWGANHGAFTYGHIGNQLITLASMLRIPVSMHNVAANRIYRPHSWAAFGTNNPESADYRACATYGPMYG